MLITSARPRPTVKLNHFRIADDTLGTLHILVIGFWRLARLATSALGSQNEGCNQPLVLPGVKKSRPTGVESIYTLTGEVHVRTRRLERARPPGRGS
jgi:hypothetical protein